MVYHYICVRFRFFCSDELVKKKCARGSCPSEPSVVDLLMICYTKAVDEIADLARRADMVMSPYVSLGYVFWGDEPPGYATWVDEDFIGRVGDLILWSIMQVYMRFRE